MNNIYWIIMALLFATRNYVSRIDIAKISMTSKKWNRIIKISPVLNIINNISCQMRKLYGLFEEGRYFTASYIGDYTIGNDKYLIIFVDIKNHPYEIRGRYIGNKPVGRWISNNHGYITFDCFGYIIKSTLSYSSDCCDSDLIIHHNYFDSMIFSYISNAFGRTWYVQYNMINNIHILEKARIIDNSSTKRTKSILG